jgi:hypothetical protein
MYFGIMKQFRDVSTWINEKLRIRFRFSEHKFISKKDILLSVSNKKQSRNN